jgi:hypothetical protein
LSTANLFLTTVTGGAPVAVNNVGKALAVQWKDTNTLYYLRNAGAFFDTLTNELWRINRDGSGEARVFTNVFQCWRIGTEAFAVDAGAGRVYVSSFFAPYRSLIGSGPLLASAVDTVLPAAPGFLDHYTPAVSPDHTRLAYSADLLATAGYHRIYVAGLTGGTALALSTPFSANPSWLPDGQWLAFVQARTSTWGAASYVGDIKRVGTNGLGTIPLTARWPVAGSCAFPSVYRVPREFRCSGLSVNGAAVSLTWEAASGAVYAVQCSANLLSGWSNLPPYTAVPGRDGMLSITDAVPDATFKAYRVQGHEP